MKWLRRGDGSEERLTDDFGARGKAGATTSPEEGTESLTLPSQILVKDTQASFEMEAQASAPRFWPLENTCRRSEANGAKMPNLLLTGEEQRQKVSFWAPSWMCAQRTFLFPPKSREKQSHMLGRSWLNFPVGFRGPAQKVDYCSREPPSTVQWQPTGGVGTKETGWRAEPLPIWTREERSPAWFCVLRPVAYPLTNHCPVSIKLWPSWITILLLKGNERQEHPSQHAPAKAQLPSEKKEQNSSTTTFSSPLTVKQRSSFLNYRFYLLSWNQHNPVSTCPSPLVFSSDLSKSVQ